MYSFFSPSTSTSKSTVLTYPTCVPQSTDQMLPPYEILNRDFNISLSLYLTKD